ncbi:ABC transporter ATP-binding protein [Candidatus Mycoplasma pogonae]
MLQNFSKKYKKKASYTVNNLNIEIKKGQFHAFVGSNGAGKTTTIKAIIGAYKKFEGNILVNGQSNRDAKALAKIAYIPEIAIFPQKMSVLNFFQGICAMLGMKKQEAEAKIKEVVEKLEIEHLLKKNPFNFSSGEQKKVLLAQALLKDFDVLVMDEPAANLDPQTRYDFFNFLKKLQQEGKTIFISSHVLNEVGEYADSVTIIEKGRLEISGYINEFSESKKNKYEFDPIDIEQTVKFLENNNISFKFKNKKIIITLETDNHLKKFLQKSSTNNIFYKEFKKLELNLKDIYSKYVLKDDKKMH